MPRTRKNTGTPPTLSEEELERLEDADDSAWIRKERAKRSTEGDWSGDDVRREIARLERQVRGGR